MSARKRLLGLCILGLLSLGIAFAINFLQRLAPLPSGYAAHVLCANVFIAGRDFDDVHENDLSAIQKLLTRSRVEGNSVISKFGIWPVDYTSVSVYRPGLGCAQLADGTMADLQGPGSIERDLPEQLPPALVWPDLDQQPAGVDQSRLQAVLDRAFIDTAPEPEDRQNTRAVVIFFQDNLIAERYAPGFGPQVPQNSWSMTKSATSAQIGILVRQGKIDLKAPAPIGAWQAPDDPRRNVTSEHLLQMTSGMDFAEEYEESPISDVNIMLTATRDLPAYAAGFPVSATPGERWSYQTASPVLLGKIIKDTLGGGDAYYHFVQRELFNKLGMRNAYYQADGSGTYVGGAFLYATPRDWARFGLLYLDDGIVNGERILPEGWVDFTRTPTEASLKRQPYAAQFWLNSKGAQQMMPSIPEDAYAALGHYGQSVFIIPSRDLVVVRMGQSWTADAWDMEAFLREVLAALP